MSILIDKLLEIALGLFFCIVIITMAFLLCGSVAYIPLSLWTSAECFEAGYPRWTVKFNLKGYCITQDGTVTVRVKEALRGVKK